MLCGICETNEAKYRCSRCPVRYCSAACFKDPKHDHLEPEIGSTKKEKEADAGSATATSPETQPLFEKIANDEQIQAMLRYKSLHFHLSVILRILEDPEISGETTAAGRREVADAKLTQLRSGGAEENELVEDFVTRVLKLMESENEGRKD